ncbi:hypothetical protein GBA52_006835 [Prunus armeniaca]|nr:hypothetical protein GBA52_006835 [Prunus armeniaca]
MRKLCPNLDREDGLETVLEVPIPEEMFDTDNNKNNNTISWHNMKSWMKSSNTDRSQINTVFGSKNAEVQLLLGVIGAPLIPLPIPKDHQPINRTIKDQPIEASMAKYIVKQYIAAVGGEKALNSVESMYAMGKVKMAASEFSTGERSLNSNNNKVKVKSLLRSTGGGGEMGGFVLWQKRPELWCLELVVSGCKISAGSDGKVAWRQTPWHHSHASRGPPRPLRRLLQVNSQLIQQRSLHRRESNQRRRLLHPQAGSRSLKPKSTKQQQRGNNKALSVWLLQPKNRPPRPARRFSPPQIKPPSGTDSGIFWETTMESYVRDYRTVDGINIAHGGRTSVSLFRFGENSETHSRTRMEEVWEIEEVDFNIKGLSMDCFLPPGDLKKEEEEAKCGANAMVISAHSKMPFKIRSASWRISASKVVALDDDVEYDPDNSESSSDQEL